MPWVQKEAPMQVENVEIERMRLHMERGGKGEVNVFNSAFFWAMASSDCETYCPAHVA